METFLLDKLERSIKEAKLSYNILPSLDFPLLEKDCEGLKDLVAEMAKAEKEPFDPEVKEKLYNLNKDLMVEKAKAEKQPSDLEVKEKKLYNLKDLEEMAKAEKNLFDQKVKEKLYYLNNVVLHLKARPHWSFQEKLEARSSFNSLHENLVEITKSLQNRSRKPHESTDEASQGQDKIYRWSTRLTPPAVKFYEVENRAEDKAMERLLVRTKRRDAIEAVGMVGMPGVGKTTLCQVAFGNIEVKRNFLPMIWVCLSRQPKEDAVYRKEVVKRILTCLGFEDGIIERVGEGEDGVLRMLFALRKVLKGKKYLIVLDDVWNYEEGVRRFCSLSSGDEGKDLMLYGLPRGGGGTVMATSRWRDLAEDIVGEKNMHTLLPTVGTESCRGILMGAAMGDGTKPPEGFEDLMDTIVGKCAGLPLVAKMMGQIVHEKILEKEGKAA